MREFGICALVGKSESPVVVMLATVIKRIVVQSIDLLFVVQHLDKFTC